MQFSLFTIYDKDELSDLAKAQREVLKQMIKNESQSKEDAMKRAVKHIQKRSAKRELFAELSEGMDALADARSGNRMLRTHSVEIKPAPTVTRDGPKTR